MFRLLSHLSLPSVPSLADLFWAAATSSAVLAMLALVAVAARLAGWLGRVPFLPVAAPYLALARPISTLAVLALVFLAGFRLSDERSQIQQMNRDLAFARRQIDSMQQTADAADRLREQVAGELAAVNERVRAYETDPARNRACVYREFDVRRLLDIR